ncbi:hypothetical protein PGN35_017640 [Nodosilinea sp. PGN35]|uniref:hypothetical protein n=1 Tax=Nodosilinea sp. PGN35 TaxID=3020489 RepID=UPI0023B29753|nr:hypothetical protein [Nodosilinea sp. TSF1-S3]MDF0369662.1 hypothetical protein [Nodosilinea sp. TSF1-S3]
MLIALFYFTKGQVEEIINFVCALPAPFKPVFYSEEEEPESKEIIAFDEESVELILSQPPQKYFLSSNICRYHILLREDYAVLYVDNFTFPFNSTIDALIERISEVSIYFGCICEEEERIHRNKVNRVMGKNIIESWVGRNPFRKVPGLYWKTILSSQIIVQNNLDIEKIKESAKHIYPLTKKAFVLTFFEDPQDWRDYSEALDLTCSSFEGIFSKEQALLETSQIDDVMTYIAEISKFK